MKILVFGDTHGRDLWKTVVQSENPDLTIFLGDYFTSRESISETDQISNFWEILKFKKNNEGRVILLRGNHDTEAMGYFWAQCWPKFYKKSVFTEDEKNLQAFLDNTQWVYQYADIVFSHAGISKTWMNGIMNKYPEVKTVSDLNSLPPSEEFAFTAGKDNPHDGYGNSIYQPCTWIRPLELMSDALSDLKQVVGHTRLYPTVTNLADKYRGTQFEVENGGSIPDIWLCDCLPDSYLVIEDFEFKVKNLKFDFTVKNSKES